MRSSGRRGAAYRVSSSRGRGAIVATLVALLAATVGVPAGADDLAGSGVTYSDAEHFEAGTLINLTADDGALRLADEVRPFPFIWIAVSTKGTIVKVDTDTGAVLGEYLSSPNGMGRDPSRTTVDKNGSVWVANRAESGWIPSQIGLLRAGYSGSVVHIGLEENGQCEDRNGNGVIDTSRGYGDVRGWSNTGGADTAGGVATAADECIIHYVRVNATGTRHVSVTEGNDVWVSGTGERHFDLIDGDTGEIVRAESSVGCGGYGGLIDANGVIWSARPLLRWDTSLPLTSGNYRCYGHDSYGLAIDGEGFVWETAHCCNVLRRWKPDGTLALSMAHGASYAQGVVADGNGDVWVAHSIYASTVGHVRRNADGTYTHVGNVPVGSGPTGVSVDDAGRVWAASYGSGTATRIDPALANGVGLGDLETRWLGGNLYNYSDMTGSVLVGAPTTGRWTLVHDGGTAGATWDVVTWNAEVPGDASLTLTAATSEDRDAFGAPVPIASGEDLDLAPGRYLQLTASFERASSGESPALLDITIGHRPTTLVARPAVADVAYPEGTVVYEQVSATLTDTQTGAGVPDRLVRFFATSATGTREALCEATTDANGVASCGGAAEQAAAVGGLAYEAEWAGDDVYAASADTAPVARLRAEAPGAGMSVRLPTVR